MARGIKISKKEKSINKDQLLKLLDEFIMDSYKGRRTKKNGSRISEGTVKNYTYLKQNLVRYASSSSFEFKLYIVNRLNHKEKESVAAYYRKFYHQFKESMYKYGYFDNYVGLIIKCLRSFFKYLIVERNIDIGEFYKSFYVPTEEIQIVALSPEQVSYILNDNRFSNAVEENSLGHIRDIFIFGCTVALRVSDLLGLTAKNLTVENGHYYITVKSKKTKTLTRVKLPPYAVDIIKKYRKSSKYLLPHMTPSHLNISLKKMAALMEDNFEIVKVREQRGKQVVIYKNKKKKTHYTLADHISTHTMRRTAITTMLSLGMPEHLVRKISGHSAKSKEFFRYVQLAQSYIDDHTDTVFDKLASIPSQRNN